MKSLKKKICRLSHSWRIPAKKISRSTRLDDISQLEIVHSCSGGGLSYMHHEVGQGGAQKGQCGTHPDRKLWKASPASMRASLRYNFNQCSAAALERGLSTTYPFWSVRRMGETNTQFSCKGNTYSSMALTGQQADLGCRRRPNRFEARSWRVFPPDVIKEKTTVTGKSAMSAVFTWPRSPAQSPE